MKHEVNVVLAEGNRKRLLVSKKLSIREKILKCLCGDARVVLLLQPGETVEAIKIIETKGD